MSKQFDTNYCKDYVETKSSWEMSSADFLNVDLAAHFKLIDCDLINSADCVNVNGAIYKIKSFFIVGNFYFIFIYPLGYTFGEIMSAVFIHHNNLIFVVKDYVTEFLG